MSRRQWLGLIAIVILIVIVLLGVWSRMGVPVNAQASLAVPNASMELLRPLTRTPPSELSVHSDVSLPLQSEVPAVDGVEALRQSRLEGDVRAPALERTLVSRESPTTAELIDPESYARYEARQNERLYRSYLKAAEAEVPKLQEQLLKGRQSGLTAAQIAEGEEKLRRIEAMRSQLMSDHPELNHPSHP